MEAKIIVIDPEDLSPPKPGDMSGILGKTSARSLGAYQSITMRVMFMARSRYSAHWVWEGHLRRMGPSWRAGHCVFLCTRLLQQASHQNGTWMRSESPLNWMTKLILTHHSYSWKMLQTWYLALYLPEATRILLRYVITPARHTSNRAEELQGHMTGEEAGSRSAKTS